MIEKNCVDIQLPMGSKTDALKGYAHPDYAASFEEFGKPRELPLSRGWILQRPIPGTDYVDGMGCYPLFLCPDWTRLGSDLQQLEDDLVSLSLVTDPFADCNADRLCQWFDKVIPFKEHYIADLRMPINKIVSSHHRYYVRKAIKQVQVEICFSPICFIDEWLELFGSLATRFNLRGVRAFSRNAFERQLAIPGAVMFRATHEGRAVGAHLVFAHDEVCYGHLAGVTPEGHKLMASYALYWAEIEYFSGKARWFDWGAVAGVRDDRKDGLAQFKRGWATGSRTSYFCGRILHPARYEEIRRCFGDAATDYFPAYRRGEFG